MHDSCQRKHADDIDANADFIASCTGSAEAGWKTTIDAIDLISKEISEDIPRNTWDRLAELIISAYDKNGV